MFGCVRKFQENYRNMSNDRALVPDAKALEMVTIDAAKTIGLALRRFIMLFYATFQAVPPMNAVVLLYYNHKTP